MIIGLGESLGVFEEMERTYCVACGEEPVCIGVHWLGDDRWRLNELGEWVHYHYGRAYSTAKRIEKNGEHGQKNS